MARVGRRFLPSFFLSFVFCFYYSPPAFNPDLFYPSYLVGAPLLCSSLFRFSAMNIVEIMCRAPVVFPARVFLTPPTSPAYLSFAAALFVGFHGLHPDSCLSLCCCWLSVPCRCARVADRGRVLRLKRRYSAGDEGLDGFWLLQRGWLQWMFLVFLKLSVCLGCNNWLARCTLFCLGPLFACSCVCFGPCVVCLFGL
ncbi:hypothetical protein D8674_028996 [Pyrus ussuriensis x Pyrus communis]|uniref:Uncharacterized protein n=1 Tax=Pyrus ussuriensis x Pyrus communis TaxID=2448454 RepID=A0A5N5HYR9_9ROSA|nr:hypothetical protein D8674_028996 [Pyrus ussuriensis x Pyrus communis]